MSRCLWLVLCVALLSSEHGAVLFAQSGKTLTLKEAEDIAVKAHPRLSAAQFLASAAKQVPTQSAQHSTQPSMAVSRERWRMKIRASPQGV